MTSRVIICRKQTALDIIDRRTYASKEKINSFSLQALRYSQNSRKLLTIRSHWPRITLPKSPSSGCLSLAIFHQIVFCFRLLLEVQLQLCPDLTSGYFRSLSLSVSTVTLHLCCVTSLKSIAFLGMRVKLMNTNKINKSHFRYFRYPTGKRNFIVKV